jgi:ABC-type nitrate/sulfonate/bicarbonate transport system substrate-binding protein
MTPPGSDTSRLGRRVTSLAVGVVTLTLALAACGSQSGSGSTHQWIDGIVVPKGDAGFEYMAQARGYFKKQGVDVKLESFIGTVQLTQALLAGSIDSAEMDPTAALKADLKGANLKIIGSTLPGLTYDLVAKSSIKSVNDLPGKTVASSAPGALPDHFTRAVLALKGINPNSVTIVAAGSDAQRFLALLHGRVDATPVSAEFEPRIARSRTVHVIARAADVVPNYPRLTIVASASSLKHKGAEAVSFLAAEMQGIRYALAYPQAEIALTARILHKPTSDPGIAYLDHVIVDARAASPTVAIPMAKLRWLVNFDYAHGILDKKPDLGRVTDDSFRERALRRIAGA